MPSGGFEGRQYVPGLISRANRLMQVTIDRRLVDVGISFAQYLVLVRLWRASPHPVSQTYLAGDLELERSSMSTLLGSLERAGLTARTTDPADSRRRLVGLTQRGSELEEAVLRVIDEYESDLLVGLGNETVDSLNATLGEILERARALRLDVGP